MSSRIHLKSKAVELRKAGKSYSQIVKELKLSSKGTLSLWFKNVKLPRKSILLLEKNNNLAVKRGLHKFNSERTHRVNEENEIARANGASMISQVSLNELLILGVALYWGEGSKSEKNPANRTLAFTNSDPDMVAIFLCFLRRILGVNEEKIRAGIHIYPTIDQFEARKYWAKITNLPRERFYIVNQISRASRSRRPSNLLPYGTAVIKVNDRKLFFKMKGMIQGLIKQTHL